MGLSVTRSFIGRPNWWTVAAQIKCIGFFFSLIHRHITKFWEPHAIQRVKITVNLIVFRLHFQRLHYIRCVSVSVGLLMRCMTVSKKQHLYDSVLCWLPSWICIHVDWDERWPCCGMEKLWTWGSPGGRGYTLPGCTGWFHCNEIREILLKGDEYV